MATAIATMDNNECQYGVKCYRKNPTHLMSRRHKHLETILPRFQQQGLKLTSEIINEFQIQNPTLIEEQLAIMHTCKLSESNGNLNPTTSSATGPSNTGIQNKPHNTTKSGAASFVSFNQTKSAPQKLPKAQLRGRSNPTILGKSSQISHPSQNSSSISPVEQSNSSAASNCCDDKTPYLNALKSFSTSSSDDSVKCSICLNDESPYDEVCPTTDTVALQNCQHLFHTACLVEMMSTSSPTSSPFINCPKCKRGYGTRTGTQPTTGKMQSRVLPSSLEGYPNCGTIEIVYTFKAGMQGPEHPHPGQVYTAVGFPRRAYLPDNEKGQLVLKLLRIAFERRLVFTVGRSITTGQDDVITWNDIHHKTKTTGPHGYPDDEHLDKILGELEGMGITKEDLTSST